MPDRRTAPPASRYVDQRHYAVVHSLDDLRGPTSGMVRLSRSLDWSGNPVYDLDDDGDALAMYQTVLNEATTSEELRTWLDAGTLQRLWQTLWLPGPLRRQWENRFPGLADQRLAAS